MLFYILRDLTFTFGALFYLLTIRPTKIRLIQSIGLVIPFCLLLKYASQLIAIGYLFIVASWLFYSFKKSIIAFFDVIVVLLISIFSDNLAQLINSWLTTNSILLETFWFILFFISLNILYKNIVKKKLSSRYLSSKMQLLLLFIGILTLGMFYLNVFFLGVQDNDTLTTANFFIQITYMLLIVFAVSSLVTNLNKMQMIRQKEVTQQQFFEYMQVLEQVNTDMQKFRHDYINILMSLQNYIEDEDVQGLKQYFYSHIMQAEQQTLFQSKMIVTLENLQIVELKGLLSSKLLLANRLQQRVTIEIPHTISSVNMSLIDLTRVLGILIDNALEASVAEADSVVHIAILPSHDHVVIVIDNPLQDATFNISTLFDYQSSSKGEDRGIGLANVKEILQTYPNVTLNTRIEKQQFIQELQIY
ncbi:GHKL domain-containing protein [Lysinibacillus sp. UGB7]|uniref:GHKL domain-containing protein n=1 Tax=Lysinibacillus sp. UGB7 TaxID=3411039 RepID=UPI003B781798